MLEALFPPTVAHGRFVDSWALADTYLHPVCRQLNLTSQPA